MLTCWLVAYDVAHSATVMVRIQLAFVGIASDIKKDVNQRYHKALKAVQSETRDAFFERAKISLAGTTSDAHAMLNANGAAFQNINLFEATALWTGVLGKRESGLHLAIETDRNACSPDLATISPGHFRTACQRYPARKVIGPDGWQATELATLPAPVLDLIVWEVNSCVAEGAWPEGFATAVMALLPKPSGGHRCVAKTPMLYRM